ERKQTAARAAMMPGAEGERRLDLDADTIRWHPGARMRGMHDETASQHGTEALAALADPIRGPHRLQPQPLPRLDPCPGRNPRPQGCFLGRVTKIERQQPAPIRLLER